MTPFFITPYTPRIPQEESLVIFYAIELLRAVEKLHSVDIIHGNISPDTVLSRSESSAGDWDPQWNGAGLRGWADHGARGFGEGKGARGEGGGGEILRCE